VEEALLEVARVARLERAVPVLCLTTIGRDLPDRIQSGGLRAAEAAVRREREIVAGACGPVDLRDARVRVVDLVVRDEPQRRRDTVFPESCVQRIARGL